MLYFVVAFFLFAVLIASLTHSMDVKNIKDYALARYKYSTAGVLATLTLYYAGYFLASNILYNVYEDGWFAILPIVGMSLGFMLFAKLIARYFDGRFEGMISIGDMIKRFYGNPAETFSIAIIVPTLVFAVSEQFSMLGNFTEAVSGADHRLVILGIAILLSICVGYGGINAVISGGAVQFGSALLFVPLLLFVGYEVFGDYSFKSIETGVIKDIYLCPSLYYLIPAYAVSAVPIHRFLMLKNRDMVRNAAGGIAWIIIALGGFFLLFVVLAKRALVDTAAEMDTEMGSMLSSVFLAVFKLEQEEQIFVMVGFVAIFMSVISSMTNSAAILLAGKFCEDREKEHTGLSMVRGITVLIVLLASFLAVLHIPCMMLLKAFTAAACFISVALMFAIARFDVSKRDFWITGCVNLIFALLCWNKAWMLPVCAFVSLITFSLAHFVRHGNNIVKNVALEHEEVQIITPVLKPMLSKMFGWVKDISLSSFSPRNIMYKLTGGLKGEVINEEPGHIVLAMFLILNFFVPAFMWTPWTPEVLDEHMMVEIKTRFFSSLLCLSLLFEPFWALRIRRYFKMYYFASLTFCMPFCSTLMYIVEGGVDLNALNIALCFSIVGALMPWPLFILSAILGFVSASVYCYLDLGIDILNMDIDYFMLGYSIVLLPLCMNIFVKHFGDTSETKLKLFKKCAEDAEYYIGKSIREVKASGEEAYEAMQNIAKEVGSLDIDDSMPDDIKKTSESFKEATAYAERAMEMNLARAKMDITPRNVDNNSITDILQSTISLMSFVPDVKKKVVLEISYGDDFIVHADEWLIKNIFWNVIENAVRIGLADYPDGKLKIRINRRRVEFEDDGCGMTASVLRRAFHYFFTTDAMRPGLGLSYCKVAMQSIKGDISCSSSKVKGTKVVVDFGRVANFMSQPKKQPASSSNNNGACSLET